MKNIEQAQFAILQLDQSLMKGRRLTVGMATPATSKKSSSADPIARITCTVGGKWRNNVKLLNVRMPEKLLQYYRNDPKFSDTQNICCNHSKVWTMWLYHRLMSPNDADGMANSVDPDQTAPLGAVWSGSALFAQAYLSENLGSLR